MKVELHISVEHRENAALQRSAISIENGVHTFSHSSGVLCVGNHGPLRWSGYVVS
ncbi:hypothetical protein J4G08_04905 [Candidatus Poribacteria bacterium]|nr:hypothetical protein [Candidatus Poribacteria bacterium]